MYSGCCELCFVQRIRRRSTLHLRVINDRAHEKLKLWQISWEIGKAFRTDTKKVEESWKWKNSFTLAVLTCTRRAERNSQSRKEYWVKRVGGRWVRREWMMLIFMLFIFIIIIRRFQSAQIFVLRRVLRVCRFAGQLELSLNVSYCISWKKTELNDSCLAALDVDVIWWSTVEDVDALFRYRNSHSISIHSQHAFNCRLSLNSRTISLSFLWFLFFYDFPFFSSAASFDFAPALSEMWQMNGAQIVTTSFPDKKELEVLLFFFTLRHISLESYKQPHYKHFYRFCAFILLWVDTSHRRRLLSLHDSILVAWTW